MEQKSRNPAVVLKKNRISCTFWGEYEQLRQEERKLCAEVYKSRFTRLGKK